MRDDAIPTIDGTRDGDGTELTIGEAAELLGITVRALRHWESIELLVPSWRTLGGHRLYVDADLERAQRASFERTRATREEAIELLAEARVEADLLRTQAREVLEEARAEVAALAQRRDNITSQLNSLSGVIEALAVPGSTTSNEDQ